MWFIELGLRTYFILKRDRFLTTAIFTGSASTVYLHNSLKIMFQNFIFFLCYPGYDTCIISAVYSVSGIRYYFSCSKTPKLE